LYLLKRPWLIRGEEENMAEYTVDHQEVKAEKAPSSAGRLSIPLVIHENNANSKTTTRRLVATPTNDPGTVLPTLFVTIHQDNKAILRRGRGLDVGVDNKVDVIIAPNLAFDLASMLRIVICINSLVADYRRKK